MTTRSLLLSLPLVLVLGACGPEALPAPPDEGQLEAVNLDTIEVDVAGKLKLLPEGASLMRARGLTEPDLADLRVYVEEPWRIAVADPGASFGWGSVRATDDGFNVRTIAVADMVVSLAAGLRGDAPSRGLLPATTVIYDTALTGARPRTDIIDVRVWAIPGVVEEVLTEALTEEGIAALTGGQHRRLADAGFVLGRVVDAAGNPVAGARVQQADPALAGHLRYPSPGFTLVSGEATSSTGLFLIVHPGGDPRPLLLSVDGEPQPTALRHASTAPGRALFVTLQVGARP